MHLAPSSTLHVFEAGNRRAEVQTVAEKRTPFRVVYQSKKSGVVVTDGGSKWWTHVPDYCKTERDAIDKAKRYAYRGS